MSTRLRHRRNDEGVALILALLFVVLLTVLVVEFSYESQVEASYTMNQGTDFEAYLAAKSAIARGIGLLAEDLLESQGGGLSSTGSNRNSSLFNTDQNSSSRSTGGSNRSTSGGGSTFGSDRQYKQLSSGTGTSSGSSTPSSTSTASGTGQDNPYSGFLMDSMMDPVPWHSGIPFEPLNDAIMRTTISDEYGKLNLNALLQAEGDGQPAERDALVETLTNFFRYRAPDSETPPEAIVDAILDWLDYDDEDEERPEGAEMEYYEGLEIPYACKNGPMDSIEELLLIKGMTPELYYGNVEEEQLPLSEYLTVHGDWQGRININTAQLDLLQSVFEANGGDPALAAEIYETVRTEQPYTDAGQVQGLLPEQQAAEEEEQLRRQQQRRQDPQAEQEQRRNRTSSVFTVSSNAFRIYGDGMFEETLVRIEAYVYRGGAAGGGGGEDGAAPSEEPFRVLAWNVIR